MSTVVDIDTFAAMADELYESIPKEFLHRLNGGIVIVEDALRDSETGAHVLGEYVEDTQLGFFIRLNYGSFESALAEASAQTWRATLWDTMAKYIKKHLEARAGRAHNASDLFEQLEALRPRFPN